MKAYTLGLYEKSMPNGLSWREKLEEAKAAGYDFVEMSIDETQEKLGRLDMDKAERLELIKVMYDVGIPVRTMCLSGHRKYPLGSNDEETARRGMEIMEKAILLADDLGIRIIMLAGYDVYYENSTPATEKRFVGNLRKAVDMAASMGILLGFETMETEFMNTVRKSIKYVDAIGSTYLSVYPDIGNITNAALSYGTDVTEDIRSGRTRLAAMHLKETLPGKFRDLIFGQGHVDFETAIHTAWALGVRKYVTEFWYLGNDDWKENLKFSHDTMAGILDKEAGEC